MQNINTQDFSWVNEFLSSENRGTQLQGYYNLNYIAEHLNQKYLVRIPIPNYETMDFRFITEKKILKFLEKMNFKAPRLLFEKENVSIHSFIPGINFHNIYPRSEPFPNWVPKNIARQMKELHTFPIQEFDECSSLAASPDTHKFYLKCVEFVQGIYERYLKQPQYRVKFSQIFPEEPFSFLIEMGEKLQPRNFVFSHCDIHRKNLIVDSEREDLTILDWELVLITDPCYDIAVHFHKMRYEDHQEILFLEEFLGILGQSEKFQDYWKQVQIYLSFERVKSAIIDLIRYSQDFPSLSEEKRLELVNHYGSKLQKAYKVLNYSTFIPNEQILHLLEKLA